MSWTILIIAQLFYSDNVISTKVRQVFSSVTQTIWHALSRHMACFPAISFCQNTIDIFCTELKDDSPKLNLLYLVSRW